MHFLNRVEKLLDIPAAEKELVMRELRSHYFELKEELMASGMDESEAEQEAERRLGKPEEVAARMGPVYSVAGWKLALIGIVPYFVVILASQRPSLTGVFGVWLTNALVAMLLGLIVIGTIREFILGRRPIWLTTWLPASIAAPSAVIIMFAHYSAYVWAVMIQAVILSFIGLILVWRSVPKLRITAFLGVIVSALLLIYTINPRLVDGLRESQILFFILVILVWTALPVFVAIRIFMENNYSNAIYASLFLFAFYTIRLDTFAIPIQMQHLPRFSWLSVLLSAGLICAVAWLLCVRSVSRQTKYLAIAAGFMLSHVGSLIGRIIHINKPYMDAERSDLIASLVLSYVPLTLIMPILVIFTPIIIEHWRKKQRVQAVQ